MKVFLRRFFSSIILLTAVFFIFLRKENGGEILFLILGAFIVQRVMAEFHSFFGVFTANDKFGRTFTYTIGILYFAGTFACMKQNIHFLVLNSFFAIIVLLIFAFHLLLSERRSDTLNKLLLIYAPIPLFVIPLNFITPIYMQYEGGGIFVLFLIAVTKTGDIGAYLVGTSTAKFMPHGNHKITPNLSPNKSWEGFIGGLLLSVITAYVFNIIIKGSMGETRVLVVLGIFLFLGGVIGDLFESAIKRMAGVKDSASVIPGIGGVLDTVDSLVLNAPFYYFLIGIIL